MEIISQRSSSKWQCVVSSSSTQCKLPIIPTPAKIFLRVCTLTLHKLVIVTSHTTQKSRQTRSRILPPTQVKPQCVSAVRGAGARRGDARSQARTGERVANGGPELCSVGGSSSHHNTGVTCRVSQFWHWYSALYSLNWGAFVTHPQSVSQFS